MPYLTFSELKTRSSFTAKEWDGFVLETDAELGEAPGTGAKFLVWEQDAQAEINDMLRRRYAVPMGIVAPATEPDPARVPRTVKKWAAAILDEAFVLYRREAGSVEAQDEGVLGKAARAREEMARVADADSRPAPELPILADKPETSGVSKGGPVVESFSTIHGWFDAQASGRDGSGW